MIRSAIYMFLILIIYTLYLKRCSITYNQRHFLIFSDLEGNNRRKKIIVYAIVTVVILNIIVPLSIYTDDGSKSNDNYNNSSSYDYDDYDYDSGNSYDYDYDSGSSYDYDKGYGYTAPKKGESFSEYVQRQDPELWDSMEDRWNSLD